MDPQPSPNEEDPNHDPGPAMRPLTPPNHQQQLLDRLEQELDIRAQIEEALRQSENRFRSIIDSTPMGIHLYRLDDDDRLLFCGANPAADAMLGRDHHDLIGKTLEEVFPSLANTDIPQRYRQICATGLTWKSGRVDYHSPHSDGHFEVHAFQTGPGMMASMFIDITERLQAQEALRESEERFRSFFEFSAVAIGITSPKGRYLQVNPTACRLLGYTEEEFLELGVRDITHPDDHKLALTQYKELINGTRQTLNYENRYLHKNGSILWGQSIASCVRDGNQQVLYVTGQVIDITARKQAERDQQSANRQLQNIIEFLPDATLVIDRQKRVVAWNRAMEKKTGVGKQQMLGQSNYAVALTGKEQPMLIDQIDSPDPTCASRYAFIQKEGDTLFAECHLPTLYGGRGADVWIKASPLRDSEGNLIGAIESIRDITARKQAEEQLLQTNRDLDAFVYTVSHDLRSPLTPIIGYAEYLQQHYHRQLDEQALQCLESIRSSGEKMLATMSDLLNLATVRQIEAPEQPVATHAVVAQVVGNLTEALLQVGARVEINDLPDTYVPETLLALLFDNLIGNAIRYGCRQADTVTVGGERQAERVRFYVRDHGPGIAVADRERIFEVFYRGTTGLPHKGTGIGLATVQKIARLFEGRAWAETTPGGGSTFWVELKDGPP
ncbi:MAG TPA: PAS domain S-box protein [Geopsychrobacteraceae bacterium]